MHGHLGAVRGAAGPGPPDPDTGGGRPAPAAARDPHSPGTREPAPPARPRARPADAPEPWTGGATGCRPPDPTGGGCLTGATRHGLEAAAAAFGGWSTGPAIRSAGCWDEHAWNPRSDHPQGRACDLFPTRPGRFAAGAELDEGWRVAEWFRGHAGPLQVKYLIWQGRYWDAARRATRTAGAGATPAAGSTTSATPPAATSTTCT